VEKRFQLPQPDKLSIVSACILICYATLPFIQLPAREIPITIAGILLPLRVNFFNLMSLIAAASMLIFLILVAEYISMDWDDSRYPLALMVLSAVSYGIFFLLCIVLRASNARLYLILLILPSFFIFLCLRILHFRLSGRWRFEWTAVITLIVTQCIIAAYYWPLTPVRFGLILTGPAYALIGIAASLEENPDIRKVFYDPLVVLAVIWVLAILIK